MSLCVGSGLTIIGDSGCPSVGMILLSLRAIHGVLIVLVAGVAAASISGVALGGWLHCFLQDVFDLLHDCCLLMFDFFWTVG